MNAPARITLTQGSPEWLAHREQHFNASEAGAVMGISPYFPKTPRQLHAVRTKQASVPFTPAMRRGVENEARARQHVEEAFDLAFPPAVMVRGRYSASLDGLSEDGTIAVEIKVPASKASDLWGEDIPEHYLAQMAHQWHCSGVEKIVFAIYDVEADMVTLSQIHADELAPIWERVKSAWEAFAEAEDACVLPAPMADDDVEYAGADRDEVVDFAEALIRIRREIASLQATEESLERAIREALPTGHISTVSTASGVLRGQWIERKGNVDYAKVPELKGVDLERYRKRSTTYLKLSEVTT